MESGRIKTALEIALERADRLGAASSEELRRQDEEKYRLIGKGLADRYLVGLPLRDVEEQISRSPDAALVRQSLLDNLAGTIGPVTSGKAENPLRAIIHFAYSESVRTVVSEIEQLQRHFLSSKENDLLALREEIAGETTNLFETWGIAGSAVRANVDASEGWLSAQADLEAAAEARLKPLLSRLKSAIAGNK